MTWLRSTSAATIVAVKSVAVVRQSKSGGKYTTFWSVLQIHMWQGVMSHIWGSHITHMTESCHTYEGVSHWSVLQIHMWYDSWIFDMFMTHLNELFPFPSLIDMRMTLFLAKEPLIIGLFCKKWPMKMGTYEDGACLWHTWISHFLLPPSCICAWLYIYVMGHDSLTTISGTITNTGL